MNFIYTYEKDYKADRGKDLTNDEKAFLEGYSYAVHEFKKCLSFYEYDEDDDVIELYSDIKPVREIQEDFKNKLCQKLSYWLQSEWCRSLISFVNMRTDPEKVVSNPRCKWNKKGYEVEIPEYLDKEVEDEYE